jgi:osmotically-inducible protein OsmY
MVASGKGLGRVATMTGLLLLAGFATSGCAIDAATSVAEDRRFSQVIADTEIKTDINKRLLSKKNRDLFFDVTTDIYEGRVMLTGSVKIARDRQRAGDLVNGLRGVRALYNEIQVTSKGGFTNTANDTWISTKIKTKLLAEKGVKSINYQWNVVNGIVYMIGRARTQAELRQVLAIVKDTKHVTGIVQHIAVR